MYKTIEKSKQLLKSCGPDVALSSLYSLLKKTSDSNEKERIYIYIAKIYVSQKKYIEAIEAIGYFFDDSKIAVFLDNIDKYINENNKDRVKNILLNNFEILKKKTVLKSKPSSMLAVLTNKCNLRCIMCKSVRENYTISDETLDDIIKNMKYFEYLACLGGEVFLYDKFNVIVENAKKFDTELSISTNGLLLGKNMSMFENMKVTIGVSVDGFEKDIYEKIRINGNFDVLTENLLILKQSMEKESFKQVKTILRMVIMKNNYKQVMKAFDFALKYNFGALSFLKLNSAFQYMPNEQEMKYAICQINECIGIVEKEKYNIQIFTDINDLNLNAGQKNQKTLYNNASTGSNELYVKCNIPWKNLSISMKNDVYFDCRCDCKHIEKFETIEKSWNSLAIQKIRKAIIYGNYVKICKDCSVLY
jgi:MoaA/NifB/PqqE/SkfB family radical SAM enzyme